MKLYIDDIRPTPIGFHRVYSVEQAKDFITAHRDDLTLLSLDHDAGDFYAEGGDYIRILDWLEEREALDGWDIHWDFRIHSGNPIGKRKMEQIISHRDWSLTYCDDELICDVIF